MSMLSFARFASRPFSCWMTQQVTAATEWPQDILKRKQRDTIFFWIFSASVLGIFSAFLFPGLKQEARKEGQKGRKEGRQEGRQEGRKEGSNEGRKEGRKEGKKKGSKKTGRRAGRKEGRKEGSKNGRKERRTGWV